MSDIYRYIKLLPLLVLLVFYGCTDSEDSISLLAQRMINLEESLNLDLPVLKLQDNMTEAQLRAQEVALKNDNFILYTKDQKTEKPYRSEIFNVIPLNPANQTGEFRICQRLECFRIEMYNFALNLSTVAVVVAQSDKVISVEHYLETQPDLPQHLVDLALEIAVNSEEVQKELGFNPDEADAIMERTKTALNNTRCERSGHLCVAPTFVVEPKALWAIVDLTDHQIVGVRWTDVGETGLTITERRLQNKVITEQYCDKLNTHTQDDWTFDYILTSSDGMEITDVKYKDEPILRSAKLVDWHVSYSETEGFGYSDGIGCPYFSSAAVVAVEAPFVEPIVKGLDTIGFKFVQEYWSEGWPAPCNYNYQQKFEFYKDGRFRIAAANLGRGCGDDGIYRPVTRIAFADKSNSFFEKSHDGWEMWTKEKWNLQTDATILSKEGYQYKLSNDKKTYYIEPSVGQFDDGGKGDNAWMYVTKFSADRDEGESDMLTIGPCCNTDYRQGPEKFILPTPESIDNSSLVLWYVPQIRNNRTAGEEYCWAESYVEDGIFKRKIYPCFSGPMFIPENQ